MDVTAEYVRLSVPAAGFADMLGAPKSRCCYSNQQMAVERVVRALRLFKSP